MSCDSATGATVDADALILAATDLSEASSSALSYARGIALRSGARLAVCHILPRLPLSRVRGDDTLPQMRAALTAWMAHIARQHGAMQIVTSAWSTQEGILECARQLAADLIVVGARGRGQRARLGRTAREVARNAACSVLVVRSSGRGGVLAQVDLASPASPIVALAADEARHRNAELALLHCLGPPSRSMGAVGLGASILNGERAQAACDRLIEHAMDAGASRVFIVDRPAEAGLLIVAEKLPAELIVMGAPLGSERDRRARMGTAMTVVRDAGCSVLVCRGQAAEQSASSPSAVLN